MEKESKSICRHLCASLCFRENDIYLIFKTSNLIV